MVKILLLIFIFSTNIISTSALTFPDVTYSFYRDSIEILADE
jgi:hypothetical protein